MIRLAVLEGGVPGHRVHREGELGASGLGRDYSHVGVGCRFFANR